MALLPLRSSGKSPNQSASAAILSSDLFAMSRITRRRKMATHPRARLVHSPHDSHYPNRKSVSPIGVNINVKICPKQMPSGADLIPFRPSSRSRLCLPCGPREENSGLSQEA
jgi:hypothetical protein